MIVTNVLLEPQAFGALKTMNLCRENERREPFPTTEAVARREPASRSTRRRLGVAIKLGVGTRNSTLRRERELRQATIDHDADAGQLP